MNAEQKLEKSSGFFFFAGFMLSKLQYLPFPIVSAVFRFLSLGLYFGGYSSWFAASLMQPGQKQPKDKWYAFAKLKEQFLFSSLVGFIATALSVAAVFVPVLFPPAAWLFFLGNVIWAIGELHKLKHPPAHKEDFSHTRQKAYLSYAITTTAISLVTALAATLMVVFPPATLTITIFSLLICVGLGALALECWLNSNFGKHEPLKKADSYTNITDELGASPTPAPKNDLAPRPHQGKRKGFFTCCSAEVPDDAIEMTPLNEASKEQFAP